jgi:hypothetical protein
MNEVRKTPIALATAALFAGISFGAQAAPTVSITSPASNASLSGTSVSCGANATDSSGVARVNFRMRGEGVNTSLGTDTGSPFTCRIDTTDFKNGTYTFEAIATAKNGSVTTARRTVTVANGSTGGGSGGGSGGSGAPTVSISSPGDGASVSGKSVSFAASASDSNGISSVQFKLGSTTLKTDTSSPYSGSFDSTKFANGSHTLEVTATDRNGVKTTTQRAITIANGGSTTPPPSNSGPVVSFTKPANNATVAAGAVACTVTATDPDGVKQVQWFHNDKLVNTEGLAPYDICKVNATTNGTHKIKAVATDAKGNVGQAEITINVGSSGGGGSNTPPTVGITSPASGAKLSGKSAAYVATASDTGGSVAKVEMFLGTKLVSTKTAAPYSGTIDTTQVGNGAHMLMAVATDNLGAQTTTQRSVTVENSVTPPPDPDPNPNPGQGTNLPSTNVRAVPTFESVGVYWKPGSNPGAAGCKIRFRKTTDSTWREGLAMGYVSADSECRGSLVHLEPGTNYAVEMGTGSSFTAGINTKTWSENFPIAQTIHVSSSSQPLNITSGGTANGYILYTPAPGSSATIDVANGADYNVKISAPYVIVRGLTLKNARQDGILLTQGAKDVVIEDNDISGWGRIHPQGKKSSDGWQIGENADSGIAARCGSGSTPWLERSIIQRNKIHHPRYGSNSWSDGHPYGPNAVLFKNCGGNHVFRYNEAYSSPGHYFMDVYGGGTNFSNAGMPTSDSDIYGNILMHAWDDAIEAEGSNMNVRVWGNYFDQTATGVASTSTSKGPIYIWRNVWNRNRNKSMVALDSDSRLYMFKSGSVDGFKGGKRYVFHNTMLQAPGTGGAKMPLGGGAGLAGPGNGVNLEDTMSRNNVFHVWKPHWNAIYNVNAGNDLDYDLTNGGFQVPSGAEPNRVIATPTYRSGHGWSNEAGGNYQLQPGSPGYDQGVRIPNFNDGFTGAAPDMGAHEGDTPAMKLGVSGGSAGGSWAGPVGGGTSSSASTGGDTGGSTGGTTTTGSTGGGVCSSILCAAQ